LIQTGHLVSLKRVRLTGKTIHVTVWYAGETYPLRDTGEDTRIRFDFQNSPRLDTAAFQPFIDLLSVAVELTHNWEQNSYELGDAYGHVAIEVEDADALCIRAAIMGYRVPRPAGVMKHGRAVIAFIEDPNGYKVELIQKGTQFD